MDLTAPPPLRLEPLGRTLRIVLSRPAARNRLNAALIEALHTTLDRAEADLELRLLLLAAEGPYFSDGMDFAEAIGSTHASTRAAHEPIERFFDLQARLATIPLVTASEVDARVNAGGMGLIAASDVVLAGPRAQFSLSEILFGLLPATIAPFLIRRMGFQPVYRMALTAQLIGASQAHSLGLVDELAETVEEATRRLRLRVERLSRAAIARTKRHFNELHPIDAAARAHAIAAIGRLVTDPEVLAGIRAFSEEGAPPWRAPSS
jgi:polyketide biosynthesis enoyl-CoA hydratase PksH